MFAIYGTKRKKWQPLLSYALYTARATADASVTPLPLTIHYANFERVPFAANEEEVEGDATSRPAGEVVESASCEHKY